jgi:N-acetylglucosamine kinase-like BadF-type ATPase
MTERQRSRDRPSSGDRLAGDRLFLAVDGGQTATRAVVVDQAATIRHRSEAGPLIHALAPGGRERLVDALGAIRDQCAADGIEPAVVFLGLTAITIDTPAEPLGKEIAEGLWPNADRVVEGDAIVAWAGATGAAAGVVAMAGTGSVVFAVNEAGQQVQAGGWSYLFGDPGSGWHIGRTTVTRMLQRWDREQAVSPLGQAVLDHLGSSGPPDLADRAYAGEFDLVRIARLTEIVAGIAAAGDLEAEGILEECAAAFSVDVAAAIGRLEWRSEPVLVATLGRTFRSGAGYRAAFRAALEDRTTHRVRLAEPVLSGLGGAALLALRRAGIDPSASLVGRLLEQGLGPDGA